MVALGFEPRSSSTPFSDYGSALNSLSLAHAKGAQRGNWGKEMLTTALYHPDDLGISLTLNFGNALCYGNGLWFLEVAYW